VGDGVERRRIESFVKREQLDDFVIFEGALNHQLTRQKLARADVSVLASFAEGVPIALMEAMATEIPCVSTVVAGIPELIRDGREGLLVPASSSEALCAALARVISDAAFRQTLGQAARCRV
jgi:colanic acid/amylovoran biosynthesis glycosyltransferase